MWRQFLFQCFCFVCVGFLPTAAAYGYSYSDITRSMLNNNVDVTKQRIVLQSLLQKQKTLPIESMSPTINANVTNILDQQGRPFSKSTNLQLKYTQNLLTFGKFSYQYQVLNADINIAQLRLRNSETALKRDMCLDFYTLREVNKLLSIFQKIQGTVAEAEKISYVDNKDIGSRSIIAVTRDLLRLNQLYKQLNLRKNALYSKILSRYAVKSTTFDSLHFSVDRPLPASIMRGKIYDFKGMVDALSYDRTIKQMRVDKGNFATLFLSVDQGVSNFSPPAIAINFTAPLYSFAGNTTLEREQEKSASLYRTTRKQDLVNIQIRKKSLQREIAILDEQYAQLETILKSSQKLYQVYSNDHKTSTLASKISNFANYTSDLYALKFNRVEYLGKVFDLKMLYGKDSFCK